MVETSPKRRRNGDIRQALKADYTRKVKKILSDHGCSFVRKGKGDHEIWHSPVNNQNFAVDGKIINRNSANETIKDAGLKIKV